MNKNLWKKFLAGLSAAAILVTSLGVMPIVSADEVAEPTATTVVAKMTFEDGTAFSKEHLTEATGDGQVAEVDEATQPGHKLLYKSNATYTNKVAAGEAGAYTFTDKKTWYGGTFTSSLPEGNGGKYFGGAQFSYKKKTVTTNATAASIEEAVTVTEAEDSSSAIPEIWYTQSSNNALVNLTYGENGKQVVYEVDVNPSLGFSLGFRSDVAGIYTVLKADGSGIHAMDAVKDNSNTKLATYAVPTANAWYNVKLVHNNSLGTDGKDTIDMYVNDVLCATGLELATSVSDLLFTTTNARAIFTGKFDNFAITKYDGIKYDPAKAESVAPTNIIGPITFDEDVWDGVNSESKANNEKLNANAPIGQHFVGAEAGHKMVITAEGDDNYVTLTQKTNPVYYRYNENANISSQNYPGLKIGEQLVISTEVYAGKTFNFSGVFYYTDVYNGIRKNGTDAQKSTRTWANIMSGNTNGEITIYSGYDCGGVEADKQYLYETKIPLTKGYWYGVDLVYTFGSNATTDPDTVTVYVNGENKGTFDLDISGWLSGKIGDNGRLQFNGTFDNYSYKAYKYGTRFNPSECTKVPQVFAVRNTLTFDGSAYAELKDTTHNRTNTSGVTWNDFSIKDTSIAIVEDATDDYSLDFAFKGSKDKANFSASGNNTGLWTGEQMLISMDIHTGSNAYVSPLVRQKYNDSTADRYYLDTLFEVEDGVLIHSNGGSKGSSYNQLNDRAEAFEYVLPYDQWVNLNLVYTKKDVGMDVDMYVNGYLVKSAELAYNYLLNGPFDRIEFDDIHFDNVGIKTYRYGAEFDPSSLTKTESAPGLVVAPKATFDDIAGGTTGASLKSNGVTVTSTNASTVKASTGYGKATTDNYIVPGSPEMQLSNASSSRLANTIGANGLKNGQQMVINLQVLPTADAFIRYRTDGSRYVDTAGASVINYVELMSVTKGEIFGKLQIINAESINDDKDEIDSANLAEIAIPNDRWSTVTLVYTAGDAAITTAGSATQAEVVTATKNDTVTAYVNGKLALEETELAENNLFRKYSRLDFSEKGNFDNIEVLFFEDGDFEFESAMQDTEWTNTIGFNGYSIFVQDKTLQQLNTAITAKDGVTATYLTSAGTVVDAESGSAADVDFVSITDVDGKDYIFNVATATELPATQFEYKNAYNTNNAWDYVPHEYEDYTLIPEETGLYGKAADDGAKHLVKDSVPEEATYDFVNKRINLMNSAAQVPGGQSVFNAVPVYISFDILSTGATTDGNMTILGRVFDEIGRNNGGSTIFQMNQSAIYGTAIAPKEWHNVAVQYIPGATVFSVYVDGVKLADQTLATKMTFCGFGNMFLDISFDAYIDNLSIKTGIYTPAAPADVELAVAENANFGRGNVWDGSKLVTNKSALAYSTAIADNFSTTTEGATLMFLDANGATVTAETENGTIDQIAIRDANGYISYWKVAKRTTTGLTSEGEGNYILDVADGSNYNAADVLMFVVTYDDANNTISNVTVVNPASAAGDTFFFDGVTFDDATQEMFIFHNGTLAPLK